jgi:hypothetical protein
MSYNYSTSPTQILSSIQTYTATVVSYDTVNNIAYLDQPVDISLGYNNVLGSVTSQYSFKGQSTSIAAAIQNGKVSGLSTDEAGNFVGIFNVPSTTFQTGTRVFRVDNRSVDTDPTTATCYAEATFTASGLSTISTGADFSSSVDSSALTITSVAQKQAVSTITTYTPYDPVAQSFIVQQANYPNGIFLKSLKLFFATSPGDGTPVTVSIVPTLNGVPNGTALAYSTVTLPGNKIITSKNPHYLDASTYTEFMFNAPVYIQSGVLYAFVIRANSPQYTLYYAQQNQLAVPSTAKALPTDPNPTNPTKVGAAPYVGALFESQNSITWTADQTKDLMFVMDQCVFDITKQPAIQFNVLEGLPYRKLGRNDIQHKINPGMVQNLFGNFGSISGLQQNPSNSIATITKNIRSDAYNITTTDFVPTSTAINYSYNSVLADGQTPVGPYAITPGRFASPTPSNIQLNDGLGERLLISNSNSSFVMTATMSSTDANVSPIITDDGVTLYNIRYMINNMGLGNNVISLVSSGSGYNAQTTTVTVSSPDIGSDTALLGITIASGNVADVYVSYAGSGYLTTPTISIVDANSTPGTGASAIVYGETGQHGGNSWAKYFTKKVVLAPGNDSGDLRVYYTAYKPIGTDVLVYYKILSSNDTQKFDDGSWQLMAQITPTQYSTDSTNLIEYEWAPGVYGSNHANNVISYVSTNGNTYNSFIQFAIKVVLTTNDNTNVPFLTDIRAIALPPGTGI